MLPKVSVIIPVYNVEKYLNQCLESVLNQTLRDIEIICVDDGSTDNSSTILDMFSKKDTRIKVIHKTNAGYGHAVNTGLDASIGEYIGIIDSDDYVSLDMYNYLYNIAKKTDADVVRSDFYETITEHGKTLKRRAPGFENVFLYNKILNPTQEHGVFYFKTMNIWTGIYKRDFIKTNKIRLNETPGASFQDCGFWFQATALADKIYFTNEIFYHYRKDNPNSSINNKDKVYNIFEEYTFIRNFLNSRPEIKDNFFSVFVAQKFFAYNDLYIRIRNKDKIDFLRRAQKEFYDDLNELGEDAKRIDGEALGEMLRIIDSPEIYYYESTIDMLNEKYNSIKRKKF